jgi:hypothetical protein
MDHFAGLDVSVKETSICIVDDAGKIVREVKVAPLNAIIGLTEMMVANAARFGTEKALEPLRRVNTAGTHLLSLINEVLDLSKIEAGKLELNPEPVDLARLIDEVVGTAGQLACEKLVSACPRRPAGAPRETASKDGKRRGTAAMAQESATDLEYRLVTGREPQRSCEPSDRREQPLQEKMNKTAALGRDSAAPSSPASAANRMTTTESLFAEGINDFCNKIGTKRT